MHTQPHHELGVAAAAADGVDAAAAALDVDAQRGHCQRALLERGLAQRAAIGAVVAGREHKAPQQRDDERRELRGQEHGDEPLRGAQRGAHLRLAVAPAAARVCCLGWRVEIGHNEKEGGGKVAVTSQRSRNYLSAH